ncbi:MAG: MerR family transcriptional regulator [Desulfovibrionaceae bacterium]|nr:MerR family transcriptional regulator [Desulfovibrionaceae bacterium]
MSGTRTEEYRIGEAARLLALKTCVLRFWEGEFPQLNPARTPKGQRLYSKADMALLRRIRSLLHERGMTIAGARRVLAGEMSVPSGGVRRVPADDAGVARPAPAAASLPAEGRAVDSPSRRGPEQGSLVEPGVPPDARASASAVPAALPHGADSTTSPPLAFPARRTDPAERTRTADEALKALADAAAELERLRELLQGHPA